MVRGVNFGCVVLLASLVQSAVSADCQDEEACTSDEVPLLQVHRGSGRVPNDTVTSFPRCPFGGYPWVRKSLAVPGVTSILATEGLKTVAWWNLPKQKLAEPFTKSTFEPFDDFNYTAYKGTDIERFLETATYGTAPARHAVNAMFEATKVSGVFETVPEEMRGVFWMKGNGMAEELTVFQFGRWFPNQGMHVQAFAPYTWGFPNGKPKNAPFGGRDYYPGSAAEGAAALAAFPVSYSYTFSECPPFSGCGRRGVSGNMSFAYMQGYPLGQVAENINFGGEISRRIPAIPDGAIRGVFTLEAQPHTAASGVWRRPIRWGSGRCVRNDIGSYDLVRLVDGEGKAVGSNLEDFVGYMGDVEVLVWTGFKSAEARQAVAQQYKAIVGEA